MEQIGKVDIWSQYGLAGLVIFALFMLIGFLINKTFTQNSDFTNCVKELAKSQELSHKEVTQALQALTVAIEKMGVSCGIKRP